jgi:regulation of enolase protein 1 (concanavalin A-like superfamily)
VYQQITGDVDVIARVDGVTAADVWSKAGVMIRASLASNAAHAYALVSAAKGTAFQRRKATGALSVHTSGTSYGAPRWVRLVRSGTRVTAYYSSTGTSWTTIASDTIALGSAAYVGIAVTSHNTSALTSADVSQVKISTSTASGSLPSGQQGADIGSPAIKGSVSYNSGSYTVSGAGADIWDTADQFYYVYQQATGDIDVTARVGSLANTDSWAKAGVMIRASLASNSAHATMFATTGKGYAFQRRASTGAYSEHTSGGSGAPPGWVRVKRSGSLFTAYRSSDGKTWTTVGSDSISMGSTVYVGIAVTSHNTAAATKAVVDNLIVTQSSPTTNQPPTVTLTAPAAGSTFKAPASIALSATASDPEGKLAKVEFYAGSTLIGVDTTSPFSITWSSVAAGAYSLKAVAYDTAGAKGTSSTVSISVAASTTTTTAPRAVSFQKSADHATLVTSYRLDVFASTANPSTATPVKSVSLGKPSPDSTGLITVDESSFFSALASGSYLATVSAIGSGGTSRSAAVAFTR